MSNNWTVLDGNEAAARIAHLTNEVIAIYRQYRDFHLVGRELLTPSGHDRTSLLVFIKDQPGALHSVLEPFARNGLSMTRIESRPGHAGPWQYAFFIDIEGHAQQPAMQGALDALAEFAQEVRVLGSYPVAIE